MSNATRAVCLLGSHCTCSHLDRRECGNSEPPLAWHELKPYEREQRGYWLYPPGSDVYGTGKVWVSVPRPVDDHS